MGQVRLGIDGEVPPYRAGRRQRLLLIRLTVGQKRLSSPGLASRMELAREWRAPLRQDGRNAFL